MVTIIKDLGSREIGSKGQKRKFALCECKCGEVFETQMYRAKKMKSCKRCSSTKHGDSKSRLYKIFDGMKGRCCSANNTAYNYYGGRGISLCKEWMDSYQNFKEWALNNGYNDSLSIDRINNDGNYEPDNCRWTTQSVQARNTRKLRSSNSSGLRCVFKVGSRWSSKITLNYSIVHLGTFDTKEEAGMAYDKYIIENNLEHTLNFPDKFIDVVVRDADKELGHINGN